MTSDKIYIVFEAEFGFVNMKFFTNYNSAKKFMGTLASEIVKENIGGKKDYSYYPNEISIQLKTNYGHTYRYVLLRELSGHTLSEIKFTKEYMKKLKERLNSK